MRAPTSPVCVTQRRVTLITSSIVSGSYIYVLGREEQLFSNKALVTTNIILAWDPHNCLYKHTANQEWLQMPGTRKKPNILPPLFLFQFAKNSTFLQQIELTKPDAFCYCPYAYLWYYTTDTTLSVSINNFYYASEKAQFSTMQNRHHLFQQLRPTTFFCTCHYDPTPGWWHLLKKRKKEKKLN